MPEGGRKFCKFEILIYFCSAEKIISAGVAKLVDALDLGSSGAFLKSSSLFSRTIKFFDRSKAPKSATSSGTIYKESQNVPHH